MKNLPIFLFRKNMKFSVNGNSSGNFWFIQESAMINFLLIKPNTSPDSTAWERILSRKELFIKYWAFHELSQISIIKSIRVTLTRSSSSKKCLNIKSKMSFSCSWKYWHTFVSTTTHSTNLTAITLSWSATPLRSLVFIIPSFFHQF